MGVRSSRGAPARANGLRGSTRAALRSPPHLGARARQVVLDRRVRQTQPVYSRLLGPGGDHGDDHANSRSVALSQEPRPAGALAPMWRRTERQPDRSPRRRRTVAIRGCSVNRVTRPAPTNATSARPWDLTRRSADVASNATARAVGLLIVPPCGPVRCYAERPGHQSERAQQRRPEQHRHRVRCDRTTGRKPLRENARLGDAGGSGQDREEGGTRDVQVSPVTEDDENASGREDRSQDAVNGQPLDTMPRRNRGAAGHLGGEFSAGGRRAAAVRARARNGALHPKTAATPQPSAEHRSRSRHRAGPIARRPQP